VTRGLEALFGGLSSSQVAPRQVGHSAHRGEVPDNAKVESPCQGSRSERQIRACALGLK